MGQNQERAGKTRLSLGTGQLQSRGSGRKHNASKWNTNTSTLRPSHALIHSFHFFLSSYPVPGTEAVLENGSESASLGGAHSLVKVAASFKTCHHNPYPKASL